MNTVGYVLVGHDNDTHMFNEDDPSLERCPTCGYKLDFQAFNPRYRLGKKGKGWDIGSTYDGQVVASKRFKAVCEKSRIPGVSFNSFHDEPDFFHLVATRVVEFDHERAKTRFIKRCAECGNFESIVSPGTYLKIKDALPFGFYRSDIVFASGDEKGPLVIVSPDLVDLLKTAKLRGMRFTAAVGL